MPSVLLVLLLVGNFKVEPSGQAINSARSSLGSVGTVHHSSLTRNDEKCELCNLNVFP